MAQAWRHARLNALGASLRRVHEIRAEITANVWQVIVDEGQMVAEGDEIVILESMKMEIPVVTEVPGVVRELHVQPEDVIQEGDLIALIDES
jgi:acetyl-CoA carboxylase biotin carboxyl carrier protein